MPKEPIFYKIDGKENTGELNFREQEGFLVPNRYSVSPKTAIEKKYSPKVLTRILNSTLDTCIVCFERSAGTNIICMSGEQARALTQKCLEKEWLFYYIIPTRAYKFSNIKAEPGSPVEIKFYFFQQYVPTHKGPKEKQKAFDLNVEQIMEALKYFYSYDDIVVDSKVVFNILESKPAFIQIKNIDCKTKVRGVFSEAPVPAELTLNT